MNLNLAWTANQVEWRWHLMPASAHTTRLLAYIVPLLCCLFGLAGTAKADPTCSSGCEAPQVCVKTNLCGYKLVFNSLGALQTFQVPDGVASIDVKMWGAGGGMSGGAGGFSSGTLRVVPGEILSIIVGGRGGVPNSWQGAPGGYGGGGPGGDGVSNPWDAGGAGGGGRSELSGILGIMTAGGGGGLGCGGDTGEAAGGGPMGQTGWQLGACYGNGSGAGAGYGGGNGIGGLGGTGCAGPAYGVGNGNPGTTTDGGRGGNDYGGWTNPWMGPRGRGGGGGGGGWGGGGGGGASDSWSAGGGGGGGGRTTPGGVTIAGNGTTPPNSSDPDRGIAGSSDNDGKVILVFSKSNSSAPAFGPSIKTASSYSFSLARGTSNANPITISNVSSIDHVVTIAIANQPSGVVLSASPSQPMTVPAGTTETALIAIDAKASTNGKYDDAYLRVSIDDGNVLFANIKVFVTDPITPDLPDFTLGSNDVVLAYANPSGPSTVTVNVHNAGTAAGSSAHVKLFELDTELGDQVVTVPAGGVTAVSFAANLSSGEHVLRAVVDPANAIAELDETNNEGSTLIRIGSAPATQSGILVTGSLPSTVYSNSTFTIGGQAQYDIWTNGTSSGVYVVKGGLVQITLTAGNGMQSMFGYVHTDTSGRFSNTVQAPALAGSYQVTVDVTDQTLTGTRQLVLSVVDPPPPPSPGNPPPPPPPSVAPSAWGVGSYVPNPSTGGWVWVWSAPSVPPAAIPQSDLRVVSEDIHFSSDNPSPNQDVTIFAQIHYWASDSTLVATNIPVNFYVISEGGTKTVIGQTTIPSLSILGPEYGARYVYATWRNATQGIHIVEVELDPSFHETVTTNNAATRALIVGTPQTNLGAIAGHVTDAWGAVTGAVVVVLDGNGAVLASTLTDATGSYVVNQVPAGGYQVRLQPPAGETPAANPQPAAVTAASLSKVDFALTATAPVPAPVATTLQLAPKTASHQTGTQDCVTATVLDQNAHTLQGVSVDFAVTGPNAQAGFANTAANGTAQFCYAGSTAGSDTIVGSVGSLTDKATKTWTSPAPAPITPPSCALTATIAGPPKQLKITIQDSDNGLKSVEVTTSSNTTVAVPTYTAGEKGAIVVVATKIDQSKGAQVALRVTDMNGAVTDCDPIVPGDPSTADHAANADRTFGCSIARSGRSQPGILDLVGCALLGLALLCRRQSRA